MITDEKSKLKWKVLGPGGGGCQFIPTISPYNPDIMLIACDMTASYITRDGGRRWRQFNLGARAHSFAFDPVNPDFIYAGANGLFRSKDSGETWSLVFPRPSSVIKELYEDDEADHIFISNDNWPGGRVEAILVDPLDHRSIYIGVFYEGMLRFFYSRNDGECWSEIHAAEGKKCHKLFFDPLSPVNARKLYIFTDRGASAVVVGKPPVEILSLPGQTKYIIHAACGLHPEKGCPLFYITAWSGELRGTEKIGLWKSEDMGKTWTELCARPECEKQGLEDGLLREYTLLAVPEIDGNCIYMGLGGLLWMDMGGYQEVAETSAAGAVISYYGVMKSTDGGETWRWVMKTTYDSFAPNLSEGWAERDYGYDWYMVGPKGMGSMGLSVCPSSREICCYTDLSSSFLTTDGGTAWRQLYSNNYEDGSVSTRGMDVTTSYGVHFDPFDRDHMAISYTDIGLFHSKDRGNTWYHALQNVPVQWGNTCYWVVFDPEAQGRVWSAWGGDHDLPRAKMFKTGRIHLGQGGVLRSEDGMSSWHKSNAGMPENALTTHLVLDPSSPLGQRTLYAAVFDKGVYKSVDDGATWTLKNQGICGNLNAWRIVQLPDGTLYLLVARGLRRGVAVDGALYRSTDGAEHWIEVSLPQGVNAPNDLDFDPEAPNRLYLACWPSNSPEENRGGGLYVTEDGGKNWENIFDSNTYIYGVTVHPQDPATVIIVTFNSAAFRSRDRGKTWMRLEGFDFKWGHRAIVDPYDKDMLYITTFGSSVWYGKL